MAIQAGQTILAADVVNNINYSGVDSVGTDSYAITPTPALTAYVTGQSFTFVAGTANTGAASLNVSGLGAKTIKKYGSQDLQTGDILSGQVVEVVYDGTNMQLVSKTPSAQSPVVNVLTPASPIGDSTTQFTITNTSGNTYRYTYTGTGTNPNINSGTFPIGTPVDLQGQNFNSNNKGFFIVTNVGSNFIEVTNASGVAEASKTIGNGYINIGATYTVPTAANFLYLTVETIGAGGSSQGAGNASFSSAGAGAGGYAKKTIAKSALAATIAYTIGQSRSSGSTGYTSGRTYFNHSTPIIANGGNNTTGGAGAGSTGGSASGGDVNISGQTGGQPSQVSGSTPGNGGVTPLGTIGGGADGLGGNTVVFSNGQGGKIIITEYYI